MKLFSYALVTGQFACLAWLASEGPLLARTPYLFALEMFGLAIGSWALAAMIPARFNIIPDVHEHAALIRTGPYQFIRHPMYTSLLFASLAITLEGFTWTKGASLLILITVLLVKLTYEERLLMARFPEYSAYAQATKRIIPFLY